MQTHPISTLKNPPATHMIIAAPLGCCGIEAVLVGECVVGSNNLYPPPQKPHSLSGERYEQLGSVQELINREIIRAHYLQLSIINPISNNKSN